MHRRRATPARIAEVRPRQTAFSATRHRNPGRSGNADPGRRPARTGCDVWRDASTRCCLAAAARVRCGAALRGAAIHRGDRHREKSGSRLSGRNSVRTPCTAPRAPALSCQTRRPHVRAGQERPGHSSTHPPVDRRSLGPWRTHRRRSCRGRDTSHPAPWSTLRRPAVPARPRRTGAPPSWPRATMARLSLAIDTRLRRCAGWTNLSAVASSARWPN